MMMHWYGFKIVSMNETVGINLLEQFNLGLGLLVMMILWGPTLPLTMSRCSFLKSLLPVL
jgi:hypothetical protein